MKYNLASRTLALSSLNSASSSIAVALAAPYAYNFWFVTLPLPPLVWLELAVVELPAVFDVEDVVTVHSMKPESKCCIVQIGIGFNWHKSTMMKSMIKSNTETAARQMNANYTKLL